MLRHSSTFGEVSEMYITKYQPTAAARSAHCLAANNSDPTASPRNVACMATGQEAPMRDRPL